MNKIAKMPDSIIKDIVSIGEQTAESDPLAIKTASKASKIIDIDQLNN
ncbi:hypothetical protein R5R49_08765 [Oenococcus oeni]